METKSKKFRMPEVERVFVSMSFTLRCLAQDAKPLFLLTCWPGTVPALMLAPPVRKGLQSPLLAEPFCKRNRYNGIPTLTAFLCLDPLTYTLLFSEACLCLFLPSTANTLFPGYFLLTRSHPKRVGILFLLCL